MNALGRFFRDLVVGVPLVFVGTAIVSGGIGDAFFVVAVSVVCTFGVGLLFWVPLCWFVGFLFMRIVGLILPGLRDPLAEGAAERGNSNPPGSDLLAVCRYIEACQAKGYAAGRINQALHNNGWDDAVIKQAWNLVSAPK